MGMMMPMGGDHEKDQAAFLAELKAYVAKNPDDAQAQMVLGKQLDNQLMMASLPSMPGAPAAKPTMSDADKTKMRAEVIGAYEAALKANNKKYQAFIYDGCDHGFHNDTTPRYNETAAKLAWQRTIEFFDKNLRNS